LGDEAHGVSKLALDCQCIRGQLAGEDPRRVALIVVPPNLLTQEGAHHEDSHAPPQALTHEIEGVRLQHGGKQRPKTDAHEDEGPLLGATLDLVRGCINAGEGDEAIKRKLERVFNKN